MGPSSCAYLPAGRSSGGPCCLAQSAQHGLRRREEDPGQERAAGDGDRSAQEAQTAAP